MDRNEVGEFRDLWRREMLENIILEFWVCVLERERGIEREEAEEREREGVGGNFFPPFHFPRSGVKKNSCNLVALPFSDTSTAPGFSSVSLFSTRMVRFLYFTRTHPLSVFSSSYFAYTLCSRLCVCVEGGWLFSPSRSQ